MPPRRTKRADGRYTVTISYEDEAGVKRRHFVYGRTQAEANAKAVEARKRLARGAPVRDADRSLADWLGEWRTTFLAASDRAMSTKQLYETMTRKHVEPVLGHLALSKVKPADVTRLMLALEANGTSASLRRNCYAALRGALDDAVANGLLASNPMIKVKRPKATSGEALSLSPDQVSALLDAAESLRYGPALRLILGTGLRRGEALALHWDDVDLDRKELTIRGSLVRQRGGLVVSTPKTPRSRRVVALSNSMVALLRKQRAEQAAERLRAANLWTDAGYVFTTEFGQPADPRNLLRAVAIAAKKAGLPDRVGVHTLRHSAATAALLAGVPLHVVSRSLGHSSIAITGDIYGHLTDESAQAAADTVSTALGL